MTAAATATVRASRDRAPAVVAAAVTVALWASAFVAIRYADRELSPGALSRAEFGASTAGARTDRRLNWSHPE